MGDKLTQIVLILVLADITYYLLGGYIAAAVLFVSIALFTVYNFTKGKENEDS